MTAWVRRGLLGFVLAWGLCASAGAASFRWANDVDLKTLDPYAQRQVFHQSFLANIYEPLVRRGRGLVLEPALATQWTPVSPLVWRFKLRADVHFQDDRPFTADDVVFSFIRAEASGSHLAALLAPIREVRKVDDATVEIVTARPDPILLEELAGWLIMSKGWVEEHDALAPVDPAHDESYLADHANGTGPYRLVERVVGDHTSLTPNPQWWGHASGLADIRFEPIADADARVDALLGGRLDMLYDVPPGAVDRIAATPGFRILHSAGLRTIFLGFDQAHDTLDDGTRNPFKDRRVRRAVYQAIDETAIVAKVMHGYATPAGLIVGPGVNGFDAAMDQRLPYDPAAARALLTAAGWPNGFSTPMDCPNDRYLNDEVICQEAVAMLAKVGITVQLTAEPRGRFFAKLLDPKIGARFYLMGWSAATYDAQTVMVNLAATRDPENHAGEFNVGGYSNPALDTLLGSSAGETDAAKRLALLHQALGLVQDDIAYLPLHQEGVVWAVRDGVELAQPPDEGIIFRFVQVK